MPILRQIHKSIQTIALAALLCVAIPIQTSAQAAPGVSHALATERAQRISNLRYEIAFAVKEHAATVEGNETIAFDSKTAGDLLIDYRDGEAQIGGAEWEADCNRA